MLNYKLNRIRLIVLEVKRLESLSNQYNQSRDYSLKDQYDKELDECKKERSKLTQENLLKDIDRLSEEEKEMAYLYFYKGYSWIMAYREVFIGTQHGDKVYSDISGEKEATECATLQKHITRSIQQFYPYGKTYQN